MYQIHPMLQKDCHLITEWPTCYVLLHKNALLHWFILVPQSNKKNIFELEPELMNKAINESKIINQYLTDKLKYKKTNFASIGNIVEQLHLHIVGRKEDDPCWPQPVWGNLTEHKDYSAEQIALIKQDILSISHE
ncbi:MAG: HIT domain-containing protein [Gammaproteobacteria bacterium]|nr:HIT domain-containing protein [Gammaproteobacteria bacterium]